MMARLRWLAGVLVVWAIFWLLLGLRAIATLRGDPQPYVHGAKLAGVILNAVLMWSAGALAAYLVTGLALSLVLLLALTALSGGREVPTRFRTGLLVGLAGALWLHGILYLQVPGALGSLPLLDRLPIGLSLLLLFGAAAVAAGAALPGRGRFAPPLSILALLLVGAPVLVPHDVFRRSLTRLPPLEPTARRLLVFGVDGLRQDALEEVRPDWAAPGGVTPVSASAGTRRSWLLLYGADPALVMNSFVMPNRSEYSHPEWLTLLGETGHRRLQTSFIINDSLTPTFGLQENLFSDVIEPEGGWKYWFTLNYGTIWPVFSWGQNYFSPVETTNPWNDSDAFLRDVGRALRGSHWASAHDCRLHWPIVLTRGELQAMDPWRWVLHPPWAYRAFESPQEFTHDPARATWRADAWVHYRVRVARLIGDLAPYLDRWVGEYPGLSGLFTADHGEMFVTIYGPGGKKTVQITGTHGFSMNAPTLLIPLHPFGRTLPKLSPEEVYSWIDMRDDILAWVRGSGPLLLTGRREGWLFDFPSIDLQDFYGLRGPAAASEPDRGIRVGELATRTTLLPNGAWFLEDRVVDELAARKRSSALITSRGITTFIPDGNDRYARIRYRGVQVVESIVVSREAMDAEIAAFGGARPAPVSGLDPDPPQHRGAAFTEPPPR